MEILLNLLYGIQQVKKNFVHLIKFIIKEQKLKFLVYSVTDRKSFEELKNYWYQEVKAACKLNSGIYFINM